MKCILMNKNANVLVAEYNESSKFFDYIYEVNNIDYAPYILTNYYLKDDINNHYLELICQNGLRVGVFPHGEIN